MKILIVEDNAVTGDTLQATFRLDGHDAEWAVNPEAARVTLQVFKPDVVILDYFLAHGDGVQFLLELRGNENDVPVVLLMAAPDVKCDKVEQALTEGNLRVLKKPFTTADLYAVIAEMVKPEQELVIEAAENT